MDELAPMVADTRRNYPAATACTYLNLGSRGVISNATRAAAERMVAAHCQVSLSKAQRLPLLDAARGRFARLVGARPAEVAVLKNTSEGLNSVATALTWRSGDNLVCCPELEHPNNVYLWLALARRDVTIKSISPRDGAVDAEAMAAAIDDRTRLVTASSVTFTPGFRTDLETIGRRARQAGAFFLVDGVQSLGVLHLDVEAAWIDGLATSTSKGLLGLMGLGFLYVREPWIEGLTPAFVSRYGVAQDGGHESELESFDFAYTPDAGRFEVGNYNWTGVAAAATALHEILDVGTPAIERHVLALAERLALGLERRGLPVTTPPTPAARSHLVTVGTMGAGDTKTTGEPRLDRFVQALEAADIRFSIRRGLIRFGFHLFNDASDVDRVLAVADDL